MVRQNRGGGLCSGRGRCRCGGQTICESVGQFWVCSWGQAVPIGPLDRRMFLTKVRKLWALVYRPPEYHHWREPVSFAATKGAGQRWIPCNSPFKTIVPVPCRRTRAQNLSKREADGSCTCIEGGNVDTARRTIHMTHYVLGIHNCPAPPPPQTTCSRGRPIAPTAMWERATGRFESPAATEFTDFRIVTARIGVFVEWVYLKNQTLLVVFTSKIPLFANAC